MSDNPLKTADGRLTPTILVADDHVLMRGGIKLLLTSLLDDVAFVEAGDGDALIRAANLQVELQLAIVDLSMPSMHGGVRLAELSRRRPSMPIVICSALNSPDVVRRVMNIPSVCAFVPKSADAAAMRTAIEAALRGRRVTPAERSAVRDELTLTPRQDEVHRLLSQGMSNKGIAGMLGISEGTVKNHVTEILRVLNASNRTQAAQLHPELR